MSDLNTKPAELETAGEDVYVFPASFSQQRLWLIEQLSTEPALYNVPFAARFTGQLNTAALQACLDEIIRRHEILRTTFEVEEEELVQVVHTDLLVPIRSVDLSDLGVEKGEREALLLAVGEAQAGFDLVNGPLLRAVLYRLTAEEHLLVFTMHHIISDGWSVGVLIQEITALYAAFSQGQPSPLPDLPIQYGDFACWQLEWMQGEVLHTQLDYWKNQLGAASEPLQLPSDRPRPAVQSFRGSSEQFRLPGELTQSLKALSRRLDITLFMTLLAAFQLLLAKYSGQDDITVGTPIAGRNDEETEALIGFFVNTLALRTDLSGDPTAEELLTRVGETASGAYQHQELPFEMLVKELQPERDMSRPPLFQTMFALQNAPLAEIALEGVTITPFPLDLGVAKFDLTLSMSEAEDALLGDLNFNSDLFDRATIVRMIGHFETLLTRIAENPQRRLSELSLLSDREREQVLYGWNDTAVELPQASVHQLFEQQAAQTPDQTAVLFGEQSCTYRELNERANQVAALLQKRGVTPGAFVGLSLRRSLELPVALLAILKAGAAYVPIDPDYPEERFRHMLEDSQIELLLTQEHLRTALSGYAVTLLPLDAMTEEIGQESTANPILEVTHEHIAYINYTSGSTGKPKGVTIPHRGVVRLVKQNDFIEFSPTDRFAQFATVSFDAATFEIWGALLSGAKLVIFPPELPALAELSDLLQTHRITKAFLTTALFHQLIEGHIEAFRTVRQLLVGGEVLSAAHVKRLYEELPAVQFIHVYGPTETTTFATSFPVQKAEAGMNVPIGYPIKNTTCYVLDAHLQPVPIGVSGELYIGGAGVAAGYLNRPELTAETFIPSPFAEGERLYKTGDLVRRLADGSLEFQGRIDQQVKLRGFRIELGEIETALSRHPSVQEAVVLCREDVPGNKRLVAYVVFTGSEQADADTLRPFLSRSLPEYMVPSAIVQLDALPLTRNGKVDRRLLPAPDLEAFAAKTYEAPQTPVENMLAGIWAEVLHIERVGRHDNFFDLGGHSLLATQVVSRINAAFGTELALRALFESAALSDLASQVEAAGKGTQAPPIQPADRSAPLPVSFAQQRLWMVDQLVPGVTAYNIPFAVRLTGTLNIAALERSLNAIQHRHESLRTAFADIDGQPVQVIREPQHRALPLVDLSHLGEEARRAEVEHLVRENLETPFDLREDHLLRFQLTCLQPKEHVLLMNMHHIISDGWSVAIFTRELVTLYEAFAADRPSLLPELAVQYADFAAWQRDWLQGEVLETQLSYWKERLSDLSVLDLPTDRPRPTVQTHRGLTENFVLSEALTQQLQNVSRRYGVTLYMTLLTGFQTLLSRCSGQTDIAVGSPVAGRNLRETEDLIGFFINTLVMRGDLSGDPTFADLLGRARDMTLGAYAHQDLPFERLIQEVQPDRDLSRSPLFQVQFTLQNMPKSKVELPDLTLEPIDFELQTAKFDLSLALSEEEGSGLHGALTYNTDLFDQSTVQRMIVHLTTILEALTADPQQKALGVDLLSPQERRQVLIEWNDTASHDGAGLCLHQLFEAQAAQTPDRIALCSDRGTLTYRELDEKANRLAHALQAREVGPERTVGIFAERSLEMVIAALAVLKAGGAYLPLDPTYPAERLQYMVDDAKPALLLTQAHLRGELPVFASEILSLEDESLYTGPAHATSCAAGADNLSYVTYTSGSTGRPKGVMSLHRGAVNFLQYVKKTYQLSGGDTVLQLASFSFDASVRDTFGPLISGASVVLVGQEEIKEPQRLLARIEKHNITAILSVVPTLLQAIAQAAADTAWHSQSVRLILVSGEALYGAVVQQAYQAFGEHVQIVNQYGPTECTMTSTYFPITPEDSARVAMPAGRPIQNVRLYVLDTNLQPAPIGVAGEVYIGGHGVTRGYLNQPEMTAEKFLPDPFVKDDAARMYRTGDRARFLADGNLEFLGRFDSQVKLRGIRIELGDVQSALLRHPGVREAIVIVGDDQNGSPRLTAYLTAQGTAPQPTELRSFLQTKLPDYMIPSAFVELDAIPLTPNGKVDRRALPLPEQALASEYVAPRTPIEEITAEIWAELLGLEKVGVHDDFFLLGGHSLLATQIISRINAAFQIKLSLQTLFEAHTVEALSEIIEHLLFEEITNS